MSVLKVYHNSHEVFYREPFGAVPCGQKIILRLRNLSEKLIDQCFLRIWENESHEKSVAMTNIIEEDQSKTRQIFEVEYNLSDEPGLI